MLNELKEKREALVAEDGRLTKLFEAGSTQGLGVYLKEGHTLVHDASWDTESLFLTLQVFPRYHPMPPPH